MADPARTPVSGVLLVDKAPDWTSHDVVNFVRRFGFKKVGHCGTLDPAATGLLVLVFDRATKLSSHLSGQDKTYEATVRLGSATFTQDAEGEVVDRKPWDHVTEERVTAVAAGFIGDQEQVPPMVSAIKVKGVELYKRARRGEVVERPPRPITIHALDITRIALPDIAMRVHCSKGTYIRVLAADIGLQLDTVAHLAALRRTASGPFTIADATPLDRIKSWNRDTLIDHLIPLEDVVKHIH